MSDTNGNLSHNDEAARADIIDVVRAAAETPELRAAAEALPADVRSAIQLRVADSILADRLAFARRIGLTFDGKRDVSTVLGYKDVLSVQDYRARYARGGIAGVVVDALAKAVWRGEGELTEDQDPNVNTKFEQEFDALNDQHRVWSTFRRAHILANLGSFSALLIGAQGALNTELPRGKPGDLFYLKPYGGGVVDTTRNTRGQSSGGTVSAGVTVQTWDEDPQSRRFGLPKTYALTGTNFQLPEQQKSVHYTRVIHIPAPEFLDDAVFGPPALERVWNYLDDLVKVVGGGSEAFWLRANAGIQFNIDKKMAFATPVAGQPSELDKLREQAEAYEHQLTRMIRTKGVDIKQLGSDVADFNGPADSLLTLIAGTARIPKRIFTGSEMGQLASEQDSENWADQVKECRTGYAYPVIVRQFVSRLIEYGYLSQPKQWDVKWPDIAEMSQLEKLDAAAKAAGLNDHGEKVITADEIREDYLGKESIAELDSTPAEDAAVAQIAAALRKGGHISLTVNS